MVLKVSLNTGINRIRLEFKGKTKITIARFLSVLIESDWNLKDADSLRGIGAILVLIESDWNLKLTATTATIQTVKY